MRALVVDDSKAMRTIVRRLLANCGYDDVVEAENGRDALERLGEGPVPDLALVDWNMPVMSGYEFVVAARLDSAHDGMAIVMITTETAISRISEALAAGADEYVMKPFTIDVLVEKLELLRARQA